MEAVVDTSVVLAVAMNEATKAALIKTTAGMTLLAPPSVHWEVGNALSAMLKRKRIDVTKAREAVAAYLAIPLRVLDVELEAALVLADKLSLYAYDSYVLACAQSQSCPLITLDGGLRYAAQAIGIRVLEVLP